MDDKQRIELEYIVNTSPQILYYRLLNPSGLEEWFADKVDVNKSKFYKFFWDQSDQEAELLEKKENEYVRYRWTDEDDDSYFEMRITKMELTGDTALEITDFAVQNEVEEVTDMWDEQISSLKHALGV